MEISQGEADLKEMTVFNIIQQKTEDEEGFNFFSPRGLNCCRFSFFLTNISACFQLNGFGSVSF